MSRRLQPRPPIARLLTAVGFALAAALASAPNAVAAPKILIAGREMDDPVLPRLRAELAALGYEVIELDAQDDALGYAELEETTRSAGAIAAVRLVAVGGRVEVWIVDRVTRKTVLREVVEPEAASSDAAATVAVQAVELLRASLLEIQAPRPSRGALAPAPLVKAPVELPSAPLSPPSTRVGGELAAAVLWSPGGVGPAIAGMAEVHWMPARYIGVHALFVTSLEPARIDGPEGSAAISVGLAGGGVRLALSPGSTTWEPAFEIGVAGSWLEARGAAADPYVDLSVTAVSFAPYVRGSIGVEMTERLRLKLGVIGAFVSPAPVLRFSGREVARWGRPVLAPSIGFEASWP
jgi:hypothetical protein